MGIVKNMARMASTLLAICQTRVELFAVELQEEAQRLLSYLILSLVAVCCLSMAFLLAIFLVIVLFWDSYRILSICVLMGGFGIAALLIFLGIRSSYRNKPQFLAYTRNELVRDMERLKSGE